MNIVLLRVGIDSGSGGAQGPLFKDGTFEFVPIPDNPKRLGYTFKKTYGNTLGRRGEVLSSYVPARLKDQPTHHDPEFDTFTYGDPTSPKAGLRRLEKGDLLVFYAGLEGWDFKASPALYIIGYFEILVAERPEDFPSGKCAALFKKNIHFYNSTRFKNDKEKLVLIKGSSKSRLLKKAVLISSIGKDRAGRDLKILSPRMRKIFGDFGGKVGIQRSTPRWVLKEFCEKAATFVRSLK